MIYRACLEGNIFEKCPACEKQLSLKDTCPSLALDTATTLCVQLSLLLSGHNDKDSLNKVSGEMSPEIQDTLMYLQSLATRAEECHTNASICENMASND